MKAGLLPRPKSGDWSSWHYQGPRNISVDGGRDAGGRVPLRALIILWLAGARWVVFECFRGFRNGLVDQLYLALRCLGRALLALEARGGRAIRCERMRGGPALRHGLRLLTLRGGPRSAHRRVHLRGPWPSL